MFCRYCGARLQSGACSCGFCKRRVPSCDYVPAERDTLAHFLSLGSVAQGHASHTPVGGGQIVARIDEEPLQTFPEEQVTKASRASWGKGLLIASLILLVIYLVFAITLAVLSIATGVLFCLLCILGAVVIVVTVLGAIYG